MKRKDPSRIEGRIYQGLRELMILRKENEVFSGLEITPTENHYVLDFMRRYRGKRAVIFANFVKSPPNIPSRLFGQSSINANKIIHGISRIAFCKETTIKSVGLIFG